MRIEYTRHARKDIDALNEPMKSRIRTAIEQLPSGDVKSFFGEERHYRLRVGDFRVIFETKPGGDGIIIHGIAPRGQIYKRGF